MRKGEYDFQWVMQLKMMQGFGFFCAPPPPPRLKFFPNRGGGAEQCCKEDAGRMKELDRMQNSQEAEDRETAKEMTGKGHLYSWELLT